MVQFDFGSEMRGEVIRCRVCTHVPAQSSAPPANYFGLRERHVATNFVPWVVLLVNY